MSARVFQFKVPTFALEVRNGQKRLVRLPQFARIVVDDAGIEGAKEIEVDYGGSRVMIFASDLTDRAVEIDRASDRGESA